MGEIVSIFGGEVIIADVDRPPLRGCPISCVCPISRQTSIVDSCVVEVLYHHTTCAPGIAGLSSDSRDQIDPGTGSKSNERFERQNGHRSDRRPSNSEVPYTVVYRTCDCELEDLDRSSAVTAAANIRVRSGNIMCNRVPGTSGEGIEPELRFNFQSGLRE